jgi:hypothetical protein
MENTGHFTHSIIPSVTLKSWFADWKMERKVVTTVSRIMSGHCGVRAHLKRFEIVEDGMCVYLEDHQSIIIRASHLNCVTSTICFNRGGC